MKRVSLRLPDELHARVLAIVQSRRAAYGRISARYSLNDFLLEAIEVAVAAQRPKKGKKEQGAEPGGERSAAARGSRNSATRSRFLDIPLRCAGRARRQDALRKQYRNEPEVRGGPAGPPHCALYARVSTADQNNSLQIAELTAFLARRGWAPAGIYQDTLSGARASRPGLERLLADARLGKSDAVAVWKLGRFGRSLLDCLAGIQELSGLGIRFLAVTQSIDTDQSNPTSKLLLQLLAAVAEFEPELMRERVLAGMRSARANGKHCGRPRGVVDRVELVRLREQGLSWAEVAGRLGVGVGTVRRLWREGWAKGWLESGEIGVGNKEPQSAPQARPKGKGFRLSRTRAGNGT